MTRSVHRVRFLIALLSGVGVAAFAQAPELGPSRRAYHAMAYDAESERVVLYGGMTGLTPGDDGAFLNRETWSYDPTTGVWRELRPAETPTTSSGAAVAYDAESDRVILFGGGGPEGLLRDTWAYDVDYDRWTPLGRAPGGPSARYHAAMAYSAELDRVILHGGYDPATEAYFPEVWGYDYNRNRWALLRGDHPYGDLARHAMVFSPVTGGFVVFGGQDRGDARQPFYTAKT